jgi:hypothetical protein
MFALSSCTGYIFTEPVYLAVTISPRPVSVAVGGTVVLTGTATNNLSVPQWSLLDSTDTVSAGTLTAVSGSPNSILYTAPSAPPIYNSSVANGFTQGTVTVQASATPSPQTALPVAYDSVTFFITAPSVTVSLSPATASVPLSGTQLFTGYAVGSVNNALTWQVNGVTGGSLSTTGTISSAGLYTAPANPLMTGDTVTITVISQADSTKTASAVVTLP